jgi:TolB-like protein
MKVRAGLLFAVFMFYGLASFGQDLEKGIRDLAVALSADMKTSNVKKIAVVEFTDLSGYPSVLGQFIAEDLITDLLNASPGQFDVVERRQLAKVLSEQKLAASGLFDPASIASVGKILGIQAIVTGSITDLGSEIKVNARLIAVDSAKVFAASSVKVAKQGTAERLLHQGATPDSSSSGAAHIAQSSQRQSQASDVFFQNQFLRIEVKSASISKDQTKLSLVLVFKNLTGEDLSIAQIKDGFDDCSPHLSSNTGFVARIGMSGLPCLSSSYDEDLKDRNKYTTVAAGGETSIVLSYSSWTSGSGKVHGNIFACTSNLVYLGSSGWSRFTAGISNIEAQ